MSHGAAAVAAIVGGAFLVLTSVRHGDPSRLVGAGVFAGSVLVMYVMSTLYHALPGTAAKRVFHVFDHSAIFLLIAGTYTPFTLGVLRGAWGWTLFGIVWGLAVLGIIVKSRATGRWPRLSTAIDLVMGWVAVVAVRPLWLRMPAAAWGWVLAGGLAYSLGVLFYVSGRRVRYGHFVWHLFVVAGTACHYFAVLWYAA